MKIKKSALLLTIISAITAAGAQAQVQPNVIVYGVIDTMVRHTNNEIKSDGSVGNKAVLTEGVFQGPRLGFKGNEDLGSGMSALFQLEMGFSSNTGENGQQGQLFGRQAFVGLKDKNWGEIDFGRQYGVAFDILGYYDPVGLGNLPETSWQLGLTGLRFDNSIKYTNSQGPVTIEALYAFGSQAGTMSTGSTLGFGLNYTEGPLSAGVFEQQSKDANSNSAHIAGLGMAYILDSTTLYVNYLNSRRDPGFSIAASNSGGPLANTSMLGNLNNARKRVDNVLTAGFVYKSTPALNYTLGYMTDWVKDENTAGNSGRISTLYAVADYSLSERTAIYVGLDHTRLSGAEIDNGIQTNTMLQFAGAGMGGATSRTGIATGVRHSF